MFGTVYRVVFGITIFLVRPIIWYNYFWYGLLLGTIIFGTGYYSAQCICDDSMIYNKVAVVFVIVISCFTLVGTISTITLLVVQILFDLNMYVFRCG